MHDKVIGTSYSYMAATALYWPFGPIQCSGCHITDLLEK